MLKIGEKISYLRKTKNISQAQLADFLHVSPQSVSRWETGNCYPDIELLPNLACFFDITIEELYGIGDTERIEQFVKKYSVLRNDSSYEQAINSIQLAKSNAISTHDSSKLLSLKLYELHLAVQREREELNEATQIADSIIEDNSFEEKDKLPAKMQKIQIDIQCGKARELKCKFAKQYYQCKSEENLLLYLNVLSEMYLDEVILDLANESEVKTYLYGDTASSDIWEFFLSSAYYLNKIDYFEKFLEIERQWDNIYFVININILYANLLTLNHKEAAAKIQADKCLDLLNKNIPTDDAFYEVFFKKIINSI